MIPLLANKAFHKEINAFLISTIFLRDACSCNTNLPVASQHKYLNSTSSQRRCYDPGSVHLRRALSAFICFFCRLHISRRLVSKAGNFCAYSLQERLCLDSCSSLTSGNRKSSLPLIRNRSNERQGKHIAKCVCPARLRQIDSYSRVRHNKMTLRCERARNGSPC